VVVAVNRRGRQLAEKPGNVVLQTGDTLLLETTPDFVQRYAQSHEFAMVNLLDDTPPVRRGRAVLSLAILGGMIAANTLLGVDIFVSALVAALAMLLTGCLGLRDARHAVDWPLIVVIACAFAIGKALQTTGVAAVVAHALMHSAGGDPMITLILLYACTVVFTEVLTNNASAILMFPIGMEAATQLHVHPMPFVMTVMVASSAAFITPLGYQTNLMVYGPGGYRFTDYVRVGTPLSLLVGAVVLWTIPHVWPF
jgi:di/tricarboxylate transporter